MKKFFNTVVVLIAFHSINISSQDQVEEIIVTSAFIDTSEINNPLYIIDGNDISDGATTSLGDAIDEYLGVSIADYGAAVGQPIIRGMSGPRVKILKNGVVNRDVSGLGVDHLNDVDLNDISQIEIVKGPSSLLYANGTIGGIINVVDDLISSKNREEIIRFATEKNHELIIFDDGLQDRKIDYDIKFVCFDSKIWIGNGYLIPAGPLRENINSLKNIKNCQGFLIGGSSLKYKSFTKLIKNYYK